MAKEATTKKTSISEKSKKHAEQMKERAAAAKNKLDSTPLGGFIEFIRTQGVVGLAVGLAIGTAAGDTVKKLVEGFITPIVQFIVGSQSNLETATWHIDLFGRSADFQWGAFVSSFITLVATAFVIYLIVHYAKLDKMDKAKD